MSSQRSAGRILPASVAALAGAGSLVLLQALGPQTAFTAAGAGVRAPSEVFAGSADLVAGRGTPSTRLVVEAAEKRAAALRAEARQSAPQRQRLQGLLPHIAAVVGAALSTRRGLAQRLAQRVGLARRAEGDVVVAATEESAFQKFATVFCNLFALWLAIAAVAAINVPATFTWVKADYFTGLLGLLMFSVGITTTIDDFKNCLTRPGAMAINFIACYGIMPVLAYLIAKAIGAEGAILAGMVLVGAINGGQASNLCTLIAGGDVALSVLMTTTTTLGCIVMTPLICKLLLGAVVPVDAWGIVVSTFQVVLAPIFLGVGFNTLAPKICKSVAPFTPVIGVIATVLLVGASVAGCAKPILGAGLPLQLACLALHLIGGVLGFFATKAVGYDERTCRTVAIETAMKSSAFGFLLATLHFGAFNVRVPPAVSVVWMAIVGSVLAVYWKSKPVAATA